MSDDAAQRPAVREHPGCALGIGFGLLLLLGLVSMMVAQKTRLADGERLFAEWFEPCVLPFDLEVAGATVEMRGEQVILLTRPDLPEEAAKAERPERERGAKDEQPDEQPEDESFDWSAIESGPEGTPPREVVLLAYPAELAGSELEQLFGFSSEEEGEVEITDVDSGGGRVMMDRGRLDWGSYSTLYVHDRELEWGGTFRDVVRVNLTLQGQPRVMFVLWERGFPASLERVSELLEVLVPIPPETGLAVQPDPLDPLEAGQPDAPEDPAPRD